MFDTFFGLPLHVLVLHATVILVPIGALVTIAVVLRPAWRHHYIGLLTGLNLALLALTFVTVQAGEELQAQLGGQIAQDHEDYARILLWIMIALAVATSIAWIVQRRDVGPVAKQSFAVVAALAALASGIATIVVGHSGSESRWGGTFDRARAAAPAPSDPGGSGAGESATTEPLRIVIKDFRFVPASAMIRRGQKVTVVNQDTAAHTLTAENGSFDTGLLNKGESKTITVTKVGENPYFCERHQYMTASLSVS